MAKAVYVPRINNNDDHVQVRDLNVGAGDAISVGGLLGTVESDKAVVEIEADCAGYVLKVLGEPGDTVPVGSVFAWVGDSADEPVPEQKAEVQAQTNLAPTAKALLLLEKYSLSASEVPASGDRLSVKEVQAYIDARKLRPAAAPAKDLPATGRVMAPPAAAGQATPMSPEQHGMLQSVTWHRDHASAGYVEFEFEPDAWEQYAKTYMEEHKLLLSPLIPLMAYRLVEIVGSRPAINTTIYNDQRYEYDHVNLGSTVQVGQSLYLPVLRNADTLDITDFVQALGLLMRRANSHKLSVDELQGATVGFTSMARWQVSRHIPILPPYTSLIVAHSATRDGKSALGASYDHRVLSGADVIMVLRELSSPPTL